MCCRDDLCGVFRCNLTVMDGDREALVLQTNSRDMSQGVAQRGGRVRYRRHCGGGLVVLAIAAVRRRDLEPVAPRIPYAGYPDPTLDIHQIATTQHDHGPFRRQVLQRLSRSVDERRRVRIGTISDSVPSKSKNTTGSRAPMIPTS